MNALTIPSVCQGWLTNCPGNVKVSVQKTGIADRLKSAREEAGMSVRAWAKALNDGGFDVSHTSVGDYEKGTTVPADYVAACCLIFKLSPSWILTGIQQEHEVGEAGFSHGVWDATMQIVDLINDMRVRWGLPLVYAPKTPEEELALDAMSRLAFEDAYGTQPEQLSAIEINDMRRRFLQARRLLVNRQATAQPGHDQERVDDFLETQRRVAEPQQDYGSKGEGSS